MLFAVMTSCNARNEGGWHAVLYDTSLDNKAIGTECITDHQGEHELSECHVYMDGDTLVIRFPAQLPAYWGSVEVKVVNGEFNAEFNGVPFELIDLKFETIKQKLILNQDPYILNDTLYGYADFIFREIEPATGQSHTFYFKGTICEIVRDKYFDPFDPENFMTFDLPMAIHELGEPLSRRIIREQPHGLNIELLNFFLRDHIIDMQIEELTWNISDDAQVSDEGIERLTIWYAQAKNKGYVRTDSYAKLPPIWEIPPGKPTQQFPINFNKWTTHMQF